MGESGDDSCRVGFSDKLLDTGTTFVDILVVDTDVVVEEVKTLTRLILLVSIMDSISLKYGCYNASLTVKRFLGIQC